MKGHMKDLGKRIERAVHGAEGAERRSFLHGEAKEMHLLHKAEGHEEGITHRFEGALHKAHFVGHRGR
jgi:hypothetical protein